MTTRAADDYAVIRARMAEIAVQGDPMGDPIIDPFPAFSSPFLADIEELQRRISRSFFLDLECAKGKMMRGFQASRDRAFFELYDQRFGAEGK